MNRFLKILGVIIGLVLISAGFLFFKIIATSQLDETGKSDAIVVLGAAEYAGKPSPVFEARLNHALELFNKDLAPLIITTGGTYPNEKFSEGEVGKKYLENKNIPAEKIIAETQSLTTQENLAGVAKIAAEKNIKKIILVSDPFHMYRAKKIAERMGFTVFVSSTRKSPISKNKWLELRYMGRELLLTVRDLANIDSQ